MSKNDERNVIDAICKIAREYDCSNPKDINHILGKVQKSRVFQRTSYGRKYIKRLTSMSLGQGPSDCMLCGETAKNGIVCEKCMAKVEKHGELPLQGDMPHSVGSPGKIDSVEKIKKLTLVNTILTIVNTAAVLALVVVFCAIFR